MGRYHYSNLEIAQPVNPVKLIPDLTIFDDFIWSPNSQYIATTGIRGNGSGIEYALLIYDILDKGEVSDEILPHTSRRRSEFVPSEDTGPQPDYAPVWSKDSHIIAINFRDGIYFYDITDCNSDECNLLYILDVGYVSSFDWQNDIVMILDENIMQLWDVSVVSQPAEQ